MMLQPVAACCRRTKDVQQRVDDLAAYVDHLASASAKAALSAHQASWQRQQQLEAVVKQQAARIQQQAAELEVLRGIAAQQPSCQLPQHQQLQAAQQGGAVLTSSSDSRLQRQFEWHTQVSKRACRTGT